MLIDIIVVVLCLMALFKGLRKGLVLAVFSLLSFIIGLTAAMKFSSVVALYLGNNINVAQRWLPFLAFAFVFFIVFLLVRLGAKAIESMLQLAMLGWLNKLCGVVLYSLVYLIIFSVILFYAEQLHVVRKDTLQVSITYPWLSLIGPKVIGWVGYFIPFFENLFSSLKKFFNGEW